MDANRKHEVEAAIVRIMKARKKLAHSELMIEVSVERCCLDGDFIVTNAGKMLKLQIIPRFRNMVITAKWTRGARTVMLYMEEVFL